MHSGGGSSGQVVEVVTGSLVPVPVPVPVPVLVLVVVDGAVVVAVVGAGSLVLLSMLSVLSVPPVSSPVRGRSLQPARGGGEEGQESGTAPGFLSSMAGGAAKWLARRQRGAAAGGKRAHRGERVAS